MYDEVLIWCMMMRFWYDVWWGSDMMYDEVLIWCMMESDVMWSASALIDGGEDVHGHGPGLRGGQTAVPGVGVASGFWVLPEESQQRRAAACGLLPRRHLPHLCSRGTIHLTRQTQGSHTHIHSCIHVTVTFYHRSGCTNLVFFCSGYFSIHHETVERAGGHQERPVQSLLLPAGGKHTTINIWLILLILSLHFCCRC